MLLLVVLLWELVLREAWVVGVLVLELVGVVIVRRRLSELRRRRVLRGVAVCKLLGLLELSWRLLLLLTLKLLWLRRTG